MRGNPLADPKLAMRCAAAGSSHASGNFLHEQDGALPTGMQTSTMRRGGTSAVAATRRRPTARLARYSRSAEPVVRTCKANDCASDSPTSGVRSARRQTRVASPVMVRFIRISRGGRARPV